MPPDTEWQWDYNQANDPRNYALFGSPYTEEISGGYTTPEIWEPWTCGGGHALYWDWVWYWSASHPVDVGGGDGDIECVILSGFGDPPPHLNVCG